ncbi:MAG: phage gp6-like head-tail connector protein [Neisseriaceae bacterium]|nr:phage gp6-like head-tail connector protein [Neisseriaceae bacterium]
MVISLDQAKLHLRVDGDDEDEVIKVYLGAAQSASARYLNRSIISDEGDRVGETDLVATDDVRAAILLTLGHLYANRENEIVGSITSSLKFAAVNLLTPYRIDMGV